MNAKIEKVNGLCGDINVAERHLSELRHLTVKLDDDILSLKTERFVRDKLMDARENLRAAIQVLMRAIDEN